MKSPRTFFCITGIFVAAGFAASPAGAGTSTFCTDSQGNLMTIEVNALRAGGKTVTSGPDQTRDVTAKARIEKDTAVSGTTVDTWLTIDAADHRDVISTNSTGPITLEVGKGGNGAKLSLDIPQCNSGFIEFIATFRGEDADGEPCIATRILRKECK